MSIGKTIKARRIELGLTQYQLGKKAGYPDSRIGAYERGDVQPRGESIAKLATALDMTAEELAATGNQ